MQAPADVLEVFLQPGEFYFGEERTRIRTLLGSCVAITLWHPRRRIGGMSHYMLPERPTTAASGSLDGRYADDVMLMFQRELQRTRTHPREYQVKIFGGGRMFHYPQKTRNHPDISKRNIEAGHQLILQYGFDLAVHDLGGIGHRNVMLDLWSGDVWVRRSPLAQQAS